MVYIFLYTHQNHTICKPYFFVKLIYIRTQTFSDKKLKDRLSLNLPDEVVIYFEILKNKSIFRQFDNCVFLISIQEI